MAGSAVTLQSVGSGARARAFLRRLRQGDEIARLVTMLFATSILLITALLVLELYRNSTLTVHKFGWSFFVTQTWDPIAGQFGALPFIYGTAMTSA
jgi:phosphate transport system permease protein